MTLMFIGQIDLFTCKSVILKVMLIKVIDFLIVQKIYIDYVENYQQQFLSITRLQSFTLDNVQWPIWNLDWIKLLINPKYNSNIIKDLFIHIVCELVTHLRRILFLFGNFFLFSISFSPSSILLRKATLHQKLQKMLA